VKVSCCHSTIKVSQKSSLPDLGFVLLVLRSLSSVWLNTTSFLTSLLCLLFPANSVTMCLLHPLAEKTRNLSDFEKKVFKEVQTPNSEKRRTIVHENCHFILDMHFIVNAIDNPTSNFSWIKVCFLFIEWYPGYCVCLNKLLFPGISKWSLFWDSVGH
jgi:hypothetical protein